MRYLMLLLVAVLLSSCSSVKKEGDEARSGCTGSKYKGELDVSARIGYWKHAKLLLKLKGHGWHLTLLYFSPDGKTIAAGGAETVPIWDTSTGKLLHEMEHHNSAPIDGEEFGEYKPVNSIAFSPDGKTLASGCDDNFVRIWDTASGMQLRESDYDETMIPRAYGPDDKPLPSDNKNNRGIARSRQLPEMKHTRPVNSVAFSPDGKKLASGCRHDTVRIWDTASGYQLLKMKHGDYVNHVAFSPDGKTLASGSDDKTVRIWDTASGKQLHKMEHGSWVNHMAFSPDGKTLASGSGDKTVRIWDTASGRELHIMEHDDWVRSIAFSPDGKTLASGSDDKTVRIWDTASGKQLHKIEHGGHVNHVAFSPDGKTLASGSSDKTVRIWDVASGKQLNKMEHDDKVFVVVFSPDGKTLASAGLDGIVHIWGRSLDLRG